MALGMSVLALSRHELVHREEIAQCKRQVHDACVVRYVELTPQRTSALHCGNGFDAGFSPYQSTHLSRYDAVS